MRKMRALKKNILFTLLILTWGHVPVGFGSESAAQEAEQVPVPAAGMNSKIILENPEAFGEGAGEAGVTEYKALAGDKDKSASTGEKTYKNITGAFGLTLGEVFAPWMVAKVISQEEARYKGRGEDQTEYTGTQYQVEPAIANPHFNQYLVKTNQDGIIYNITARQNPSEKAAACEQSRNLGKLLMSKYGRPRGAGVLGEWYTFRDMTAESYRGIRLYAQRCRNGRYQIQYTDEGAMMQSATGEPVPEAMAGL
jgi:hypothetical protein